MENSPSTSLGLKFPDSTREDLAASAEPGIQGVRRYRKRLGDLPHWKTIKVVHDEDHPLVEVESHERPKYGFTNLCRLGLLFR